jgi:serine/threonine protein kinase
MSAPPDTITNIGGGAYGRVDLVKINGIECAAKTIYNALVGKDVNSIERRPMQEKFRQECITICRMRHPNVVQFMGVYCNDHRSLNLVLFMEHLPIDLHKCLEEAKKRNYSIPIPMKLSILIDICRGLSHIHSFLLLHRDLTAKNVLLTHHVRAKISDFGSSKLYNLSQKLSKAPGNLAYMPPEARSETPIYDTALDVFSFGVLTLFVFIQEFPELPMNLYLDIPRDIRDRGEEEVFIRGQWVSKLNEGHPLRIRTLIYNCLQRDPSKRPTVNQLLENYLCNLNNRLSMEIIAKAHTEMLLYFNEVLP